MTYKIGQDRCQRVLFPDCIDEYVEADAPVRLFDAFVDNFKMDELGFVRRLLQRLVLLDMIHAISSNSIFMKCKCTIQKFKEADVNKYTLIKAT